MPDMSSRHVIYLLLPRKVQQGKLENPRQDNRAESVKTCYCKTQRTSSGGAHLNISDVYERIRVTAHHQRRRHLVRCQRWQRQLRLHHTQCSVITTVSLTDRRTQNFWDYLSASRWNNLSDMPITASVQSAITTPRDSSI